MHQHLIAEFIRLRFRRLTLFPIGCIALFALLPVVFLTLSSWNPVYVGYLEGYTDMPSGPISLIRGALYLLPAALAALIAATTAEDHASGHLKVVLPRMASRSRLLFGKLAAMCVMSFAAFLILSISVFAVCFVVAGLPSISIHWGHIGSSAVYFGLLSIYISVLSVGAATLVRTPAAATVLAVLSPHALRALTFLPGGSLLPAIHLDVLEFALLPGSRFSEDELATVLGATPNTSLSMLVVALSCTVIAALTFVLFSRRDV